MSAIHVVMGELQQTSQMEGLTGLCSMWFVQKISLQGYYFGFKGFVLVFPAPEY